MSLPAAALAAVLALAGALALDQRDAVARETPVVAPVLVDTTLLKAFRWRNIGPDRGGRSIASSGVKGRRNEAYFGAVGGGLWKTTDGGETWAPVTDGQLKSASVGAVAVSESNPDIVYIGMGESCIRGNIMSGDGVYRSTDAGKTWTNIGFASSKVISKIRIHPTNPQVVFVAAFGKLSAPNAERGVFKSSDGGGTWRKVLYRDDRTAAIDLAIDRNNPDVMYAAMWEAYRKEYQMSSGGAGSGLFKSTDGGATWVRVNENRSIRQRAFYYTHVFADPKNADVVYLQNTSLFRSADGGKTIASVGDGTHGDFHDLWIDPEEPAHMVVANDGGGAVTTTTGAKWTDEDFPTEQFYHVATTTHLPYHVCGSQQDNSTLCVPFNWNAAAFGLGGGGRRGGGGGRGAPARDITAGGMAVAYVAGGGEPGYIAPDPRNQDLYYSGTNNGGYVDKFDRRLNLSREVNPYPWFYSGEPSRAIRERWQWTFPIIFSPRDPSLLYVSSQRLWKTTDGGQGWTAISGDLTRHDDATMGPSGGPITGDMNGPEVYAVIFAVGPGKTDKNVIWTGSDDGLVHVTKDGGKSWTNVTPPGMPDYGRVSQIDASAFSAGAAYIAVKRPLLDDFAPYIYKTSDFGKTWTKIVNGLAADNYVHAVREDPTRRGMLYAATQHGVFLSHDDGANWQSLVLNMPDAPVVDLIVEGNELVIASHGRGFWVLDNIAPLRQYAPEVALSEAFVFAPPVAVRSGPAVVLSWWVKAPATRAKLEIVDSSGAVLRTYVPDTARAGADTAAPAASFRRPTGPTLPNAAGLNRIAWDLRTEGAVTFPGMIFWGAGTNGPAAPPGRYTIRLTAGEKAYSTSIMVVRNPYLGATNADLHAQYAFGRGVRDKVTEANQAIVNIRRVKAQLDDRLKKADDARLKTAGDTLRVHASGVEQDVYQVKNQSGQDPLNFPIKVNNRLANLLSMSERGDGRPTNNLPEIFGILNKELKQYTDRLDVVWKTDLKAVNAELSRLRLPPLDPNCAKAEGCQGVTP